MKGRIFLFLMISTLLFNCSNSTSPILKDSEFGIYLLKDTTLSTSEAMNKSLESLQVQEKSLIDLNGIVAYDWSEHLITISSDAYENVKYIETKTMSTTGLPFVIIVDDKKIYLGIIFPLYSSSMPEDLPHIYNAPLNEFNIRRARLDSEDKRNDERIYSVLKKSGKLKN